MSRRLISRRDALLVTASATIAAAAPSSVSAQTPAATSHAIAGLSAQELELRTIAHRAVDAALWGMPAASMAAFRRSLAGVGAGYNEVLYFSKPLEARHEFLTANNNTPYVAMAVDLHHGPMVIEVPAASTKVALFGSAIDSFQVPLVDVGPTGDDAGKGGKYLFLPPGYRDSPPSGYFVIPSTTNFLHVAFRPIIGKGATIDDGVAYAKTLNVYPLANAANPAPTKFVDAYPQAWHTLPVYDLTFFKDIAAVVNDEPTQERDAAMLGLLASIGIEKGKPFNVTGETAKIFEQAVTQAYDIMQAYLVGPGSERRWADRQWVDLKLTHTENMDFMVDGKLLVDERATIFFVGTWIPKKLAASAYPMVFRDRSGTLLKGDKTYRLRVPADTPARDFWSVIVYSMKTKSMISNAQNIVGLSSYDKSKMQMNSDGSVDLYFAPKAPTGKEANWIPTGEDFFIIFRLYGPEKAYFDKTWKLPDIESIAG
jgi:hypothetical protein